MKARAFDYVRAASAGQAMEAYAACAGEARYIAGGQSLLPAMNLRLDAPDLLIDIAHVGEFRGIAVNDGSLRIGALTRHAEILVSRLVRAHAPMLSAAAAFVAHPAIRNKGTMGGSLALADPASEFPAAILALGARIETIGIGGARAIDADDYFLGLYETALLPGEIISAISIPASNSRKTFVFDELARRRGDYAMAGIALQTSIEGGAIAAPRLVFFSMGPTPMRARQAEHALAGIGLDAPQDAALDALAQDLDPPDDVQVSRAMRLHLARVLLKRGLAALQRESASQ